MALKCFEEVDLIRLIGFNSIRISCNFCLNDLYTKYSYKILYYSYLKASIGFNLAAFFAGKYPKAIPTKAANPKPISIE